jgi:hypothetical protein
VVVLESAKVVGGRTRSTKLEHLDPQAPKASYGGTWVMLDNEDLLSLSHEVKAAEEKARFELTDLTALSFAAGVLTVPAPALSKHEPRCCQHQELRSASVLAPEGALVF